MRILWHSNAPWAATGYGVQTKLAIQTIPKVTEHELAVSAFYGLRGHRATVDGVTIYPAGYHPYGNDIISAHAEDFKADIILTLADAWVFEAEKWETPWAAWTPVDHTPMPDFVADALRFSRWQIAYSEHGHRQMIEAGFPLALYVPHSVDTKIYTPGDQREARERIGMPMDRFVVGMVGINKDAPARKCFPQALFAFKEFKQSHPDALLYLHTNPFPSTNGIDIMAILEALELTGDDVLICDQYQYVQSFPDLYMRDFYRAMDVLLMPSRGEGFGVPIIEAQACETLVIANDNTAMSELVAGGWLLKNSEPWWSEQSSWQSIPRVSEIVLCLDDAFEESGYDFRKREAIAKALEYDMDLVAAEYWQPVLDQIESEL